MNALALREVTRGSWRGFIVPGCVHFIAMHLPGCASQALAAVEAGAATVIDGDTLSVDGRTVRLFGIDAPELDQPCERDGAEWACGVEAAERLRSFIGEVM